ncbi:MAG: GNAT family N-acetyltransferase [Alphaproteobacteria bacterium]|nr:GNAT family N-acetyltransferase [Alphaproteobacteria bacterium]
MATSTSTPTTGADAPVEFAPLLTERLLLRPLVATDAGAIQRYAGLWDVARRTSAIPHPYPPGAALAFVTAAREQLAARLNYVFATVLRGNGEFVGCIEVRPAPARRSGIVGYWIAPAHWGQGYAGEALPRLIQFAFDTLGLDSLAANVHTDNPASARVLEKSGFIIAGRGTEASRALGHDVDVLAYALERPLGGCDPKSPPPPALPVVLVVAAALVDPDNRVLIARRPPGKRMGGLWEFPGGKVGPDESPEQALVRELREELAIDTSGSCLAPFTFASHRYEDFHLLMPLYVCRTWRGTPTPQEGQELAWVRPVRLADYPMPPADRPLVAMLRDLL